MQKKRWIACVLATVLGVLAPTQAFAANADWTEGNALIAHALGEYEGKIETNSKEAFLQSWENGFRVMEADFVYTSDNVLVVRHDFHNRRKLSGQGGLCKGAVSGSHPYACLSVFRGKICKRGQGPGGTDRGHVANEPGSCYYYE